MSKLQLTESKKFGTMQCDFWRDEKGDILLTREQIGSALEYSNPQKAIDNLHGRNKDRLGKFSVTLDLRGTDGKIYKTTLYTAKGVYEICRFSRQPKANQFMDWVWDAVESIRKHGAYMTPQKIEEVLLNPDTIIELATRLKEEQALTQKQRQIIGELKPKADYTDLILKNKGLVTITQIAKDYGMSGQAMNRILHRLKVQYKQSGQWLLYREHQAKGYTHSETVEITRKDGTPDVKMNTKWTQKGRLFLYELLRENGILPVIEQEVA